MIIGVLKETIAGDRRVSLIPAVVPSLAAKGLKVRVETTAGREAGFLDEEYEAKGAEIAPRAEVLASSDILLSVRGLPAEIQPNQTSISMLDPLWHAERMGQSAASGATAFALELMPRITRAQSMDVLSSMATISGYKAVLLAAEALPRMFPMLMTAAGTISPAHVFIIGAGVAGLQAIATSRRLGAIVSAYDLRPVVKEQVQSLGAKFVEMELTADEAEEKSGYARAMGEEFYQRQRELLARVVAENDVVITTALVPGKKAPVLISAEMVRGMRPGSIIVDLAAEYGGNCELTRAGETVVESGVDTIGPANLPSTVPYHASQMYSKNISNFLLHLIKDGQLNIDMNDEITRETLVMRGGQVVHPRVLEILQSKSAAAPAAKES